MSLKNSRMDLDSLSMSVDMTYISTMTNIRDGSMNMAITITQIVSPINRMPKVKDFGIKSNTNVLNVLNNF